MNPAKPDERLSFLDPHPAGKPAVLLLHGLGANKHMWDFQTPALSQAGLRPLPVDLPGFGESHFSGKRWHLSIAVKRLLQLFDEMEIEHCVVVGLSLGGVVAQKLALACPQRVARLVLVSTFATLRPRTWSAGWYLLRRFVKAMSSGPEKQAELVAWHIFPDERQALWRDELVRCIQEANPSVYQAAMLELALFDSRKDLPRLQMPTLVIGGEMDRTAPVELQADLTRRIRGARQVVIPSAGHALPIDQPGAFNSALISWMRS